MTCIIGLEYEGRVYIGGDSMSSSGNDRLETRLRKVFRAGPFLIGYTTSFRMGQILQYHLSVRQQQDGETDERYMVVAFVEAARECLKDKGFTTINSNNEQAGSFLVGYKSSLYEVCSDFQVNQWVSGIATLGAGTEYALGAMVALDTLKPEERIKRALEITCQLCPTVCGPFVVEVL